MSVRMRNNVRVSGSGSAPMVFAHGFGCDQNMWRFIVPAFEDDFKIVLFDHVGAGRSDLRVFSPSKYGTLAGYAEDVLEICRELDLNDVIFVGHSVSAMIGAIAAIEEPQRFASLIMVGPSPCYINDGEYHGGFDRQEIEQLLTIPRQQLSGLGERYGASNHGQPRPAGIVGGVDEQLLPHRSRDRQAICSSDLSVRQPSRPRQNKDANTRNPMLGRRHRTNECRRACPSSGASEPIDCP